MRHEHHIIPKHIGGHDGPVALLTVQEHAEAHWILWYTHGRWQDKLSAMALEGWIGKEEIILFKIRQSNSNRKNPWIGRKHSESTKKLMSQNSSHGKPMLGKKHSNETKSKMSEVRTGKVQSKATIEKRSSKLRGRTRTPEQKQSLSEAMVNYHRNKNANK